MTQDQKTINTLQKHKINLVNLRDGIAMSERDINSLIVMLSDLIEYNCNRKDEFHILRYQSEDSFKKCLTCVNFK